MPNNIWRVGDFIACYTEDFDLMRRIKRSYSDFIVTARYYTPDGELYAMQYSVDPRRRRVVNRLFGAVSKSTK